MDNPWATVVATAMPGELAQRHIEWHVCKPSQLPAFAFPCLCGSKFFFRPNVQKTTIAGKRNGAIATHRRMKNGVNAAFTP